MVMKKCPKCGSLNIDEGVRTGHLGTVIAYESNRSKGLLPKFKKSSTFVCLDCGYLESYIADLDKLKQELNK